MIAPGSRALHVKFILPSLTEASDPYWRPIKYSLFPPLGLATLAAYLSADDRAVIVDEHVERLTLDDAPDLVVIQVYITNAYRRTGSPTTTAARGRLFAWAACMLRRSPMKPRGTLTPSFSAQESRSFQNFFKTFAPEKQSEFTPLRLAARWSVFRQSGVILSNVPVTWYRTPSW
jgi:hypothetical protein